MAQRKYYRKTYQKSKAKTGTLSILKLLGIIVFLFFAGILFLFLYFARDLPRPERFTEKQFAQSTKIYDSTGDVLLYEMYGEEKRTVVPLEIIPEHMKQAVIAAEDANFYTHFGLDIRAMFRALLADLKLWSPMQGASTIPQQLIRSSLLTSEKTVRRKIREIILSLELSRRYSKDQILEWYLNQVPFGSNAYGVEAAAQTFFNKSIQDITLTEAALLASLIQKPSYLSPYGYHQDELFVRKDYVLNRMAQESFISKEEAESAKQEELEFAKIRQPIKAPHFVMYVKDILIRKYGEDFLKEKGFRVFTSLDWELQELAETIVAEGAEHNETLNAFNAALVSIEPESGRILAMVGSKNWHGESEECSEETGRCKFDPKVNVALSIRQPGSAFKPFAYASAFQKGYTADTVIWDVKTNFGVWGDEPYEPGNYDGKFRGPIVFRQALAQSINVPSVKVLYLAGISEAINLAKSLGITTLNQPSSFYGLSLVLGGGAVKLLDITSAYGVFASEGLLVSPTPIIKIEDSFGNIIEQNKKTPKRVLTKQVARLVNDILSDNEARSPMFGLYSALYIDGYDTAAKTGTTEDFKDGWTIGYSPSVVTGVWAGNNDATPMDEKPAVSLAGPIWNRFMREAMAKYPKQEFTEPDPILTDKTVLNGEYAGHSILHFVDKDNPQGPVPVNPGLDSQYEEWEKSILDWALNLGKE